MTLRIGISARLLHQPPPGMGLPRTGVQYLESHMAQWFMSYGIVALMIPFVDNRLQVPGRRRPPVQALAEQLDGLVLQGGTDICPSFYGQPPWSDTMTCDARRDEYELDLLHAFISMDKPVLGICRGAQLLNVYFGGTLVQDIPTLWPGAIQHVDMERYDKLIHDVQFVPGSRLSRIYGTEEQRVNSIHHQCVDQPGRDLVIEAYSPIDQVPEAIRHTGHRFVMGVQWHPEFHMNRNGAPSTEAPGQPNSPAIGQKDGGKWAAAVGSQPTNRKSDRLLDSGPLVMDFLKTALRRAGRMRRLARAMDQMRGRNLSERSAPRAAPGAGPASSERQST